MRTLLLLSYTFPPDNTPAAIRPAQLRDYLPEHGYRTIVVASSYDGGKNTEPGVHRTPAQAEPTSVALRSSLARGFMRVGAPYDDRLPWVPFAVRTAANLMRSGGVDAIFSTSPFLAAHFAAQRLKTRFRLPWIADFQDPVLDNPFRSRRWFYPYDNMIERSFFKHADRLLANTDTVADAWRARYPQWSEKISILWNSYDPRERLPAATSQAHPRRVLAHVGSLYGERHPALLLSALERLSDKVGNTCVKLVGPIEPALFERHKDMLERLRAKGLVAFENRLVARSAAMQEIVDADFLLLLDLNENNAAFQVPSKLLDYIRAGKPILAYTPSGSPVAEILRKSDVPYAAIAPTEPEALADQKLVRFFAFPPGPHDASPWFKENFSAAAQARTVAQLLDGLLAQRGVPAAQPALA